MSRHASESELAGLAKLAVVSAPVDGESAATLFAAADQAVGQALSSQTHRAS